MRQAQLGDFITDEQLRDVVIEKKPSIAGFVFHRVHTEYFYHTLLLTVHNRAIMRLPLAYDVATDSVFPRFLNRIRKWEGYGITRGQVARVRARAKAHMLGQDAMRYSSRTTFSKVEYRPLPVITVDVPWKSALVEVRYVCIDKRTGRYLETGRGYGKKWADIDVSRGQYQQVTNRVRSMFASYLKRNTESIERAYYQPVLPDAN